MLRRHGAAQRAERRLGAALLVEAGRLLRGGEVADDAPLGLPLRGERGDGGEAPRDRRRDPSRRARRRARRRRRRAARPAGRRRSRRRGRGRGRRRPERLRRSRPKCSRSAAAQSSRASGGRVRECVAHDASSGGGCAARVRALSRSSHVSMSSVRSPGAATTVIARSSTSARTGALRPRSGSARRRAPERRGAVDAGQPLRAARRVAEADAVGVARGAAAGRRRAARRRRPRGAGRTRAGTSTPAASGVAPTRRAPRRSRRRARRTADPRAPTPRRAPGSSTAAATVIGRAPASVTAATAAASRVRPPTSKSGLAAPPTRDAAAAGEQDRAQIGCRDPARVITPRPAGPNRRSCRRSSPRCGRSRSTCALSSAFTMSTIARAATRDGGERLHLDAGAVGGAHGRLDRDAAVFDRRGRRRRRARR